jgi:hypothetical protein
MRKAPDDQTMADKVRRLRELFRSDFNPATKEQEMEEAQRLLEELLEYFEAPGTGGEEAELPENDPLKW